MWRCAFSMLKWREHRASRRFQSALPPGGCRLGTARRPQIIVRLCPAQQPSAVDALLSNHICMFKLLEDLLDSASSLFTSAFTVIGAGTVATLGGHRNWSIPKSIFLPRRG